MLDIDSAVTAAQVVRDTITEMLDHTDGVAAYLKAGEWTGQPQDCGACPISKLLDSRLEDKNVGDVWATTQSEMLEVEADGWSVTVVLPKEIREFVRDFDDLKYPELIDGPALVPPASELPYAIPA